jgi:hypothetical protein
MSTSGPRDLNPNSLNSNGLKSSQHAIHFCDLPADQRVRLKQADLEHGNSEIDFSVGQSSNSSLQISKALYRIDNVKDASRCRDRALHSGPALNQGDAVGKRRRTTLRRSEVHGNLNFPALSLGRSYRGEPSSNFVNSHDTNRTHELSAHGSAACVSDQAATVATTVSRNGYFEGQGAPT